MRNTIVITLLAILSLCCCPSSAAPHETAGWVGANYTPAYCVNAVQLWHDFRGDVVDKELATNTLIVTQGHEHPALHSSGLIATDLHWINTPPERPARLTAKTRYRQRVQTCTLPAQDGPLHVLFDTPQRALTPGQFVVFYDDDVCLGGGVIDRSLPRAQANIQQAGASS